MLFCRHGCGCVWLVSVSFCISFVGFCQASIGFYLDYAGLGKLVSFLDLLLSVDIQVSTYQVATYQIRICLFCWFLTGIPWYNLVYFVLHRLGQPMY
jgi:hypothetical protein